MRCVSRVPTVLFVMPLTAMTFLAAAACDGGGRSSTEIVTEPVTHYEVNNALAGGNFGPDSIGYLLSSASTLGLGLSSADDYRVVSETTTPGLRHIRLQQTYRSIPVHNAVIVAHADDTTFLGFNGYLTRNLDGFDITPALTEAEALAAAQADHAGAASVAYRDDSSKLIILPGDGGLGARLAYLVKFSNETSGSVPASSMVYFVDARDGAIVSKYNNLQAAVQQASGPGGTAKRARSWTDELDVEEVGGEFVMDTVRMSSLDVANADMAFRGPDLANMEEPNGNNSQGNIEITLDMMKYWMGRDSVDDNGLKIVSYVNDNDVCGWGPNNACWNGTVIQLGLGGAAGGNSFANWAGGLDAVGHEINHGFTQFHSALQYSGESGALNESFSDVAGTLAEFFDEGDGADLLLFEDIWSGEAFRFMCDPGKDGMSIDHASDYAATVDVHYSSGIPNRAFCLAVGRYRAATGASARAGVQAVGHIWYSANAAYWTAGTTFTEACRGTVDAARALGQPSDVVEGVADSWADVGAECETGTNVCNDDGICDAADGETCASCNEDCGACEGQGSCGWFKKSKCKLGIGDCSDCEGEPGCGDGICEGDETDATCGQDCGCAALDCEQIAPFGCWCDDICVEYGDCCADREGLCL